MHSDPRHAPLLLTLAWRNLWRHTRRTLMILFAFALGVWSMIVIAAISRGSMEQQLDKSNLNLTGHIQLHVAAFRDDPVIEHRFELPATAEAALNTAGVSAWARRVTSSWRVDRRVRCSSTTRWGTVPVAPSTRKTSTTW